MTVIGYDRVVIRDVNSLADPSYGGTSGCDLSSNCAVDGNQLKLFGKSRVVFV